MSTIRIAAPGQASPGEIIELKAMIRHPMETGYRRDRYGKPIPRDILKRFECRYNDELVFAAEFFPAVAADPFLTFYTRATSSGTLEFKWIGQDGSIAAETVGLEVA
jgi:sulfur-oxidizing protein SoxZ